MTYTVTMMRRDKKAHIADNDIQVKNIIKAMLPEETKRRRVVIDIQRAQSSIFCTVNNGEYVFVFSPRE